ncbi:MAG: SDR family oxidoreductase UcpA [Bacillota bacterium]
MKKLDGKIAIVTGSAMGIGEGIARVLAKHGAHVMLFDRDDKVFESAKAIETEGFQAAGFKVDVTNFDEVKNTVAEVHARFGKIDVLVNNAGVIRLGNFPEMSNDTRDFHIQVNINGVWNVSKAVIPYMIEKKYGKIVNMSSVTGYMVADPGEVAYATTKSAIIGFTRSLAAEMAEHQINVNAICPGYIYTPMAQQIGKESNPDNPESVIEGIANAVPLKRLGKPEEVGELAAFLASDESSYITGTQVVIDGGSTLPETTSVGV